MTKETRSGSNGPITLEKLIALGERHVNRILLEDREKGMAPLWHLVTPEGEQDFVIMTPWNGDFEKKLSVAKVRELAHEHNAIAVGFVTECWMLDIKRADVHKPHPRPSESPNRIEAVMILAHDKERTIAKGLQTIRDKPGGRIISLIEHMPIGESKFESWMLEGMLP